MLKDLPAEKAAATLGGLPEELRPEMVIRMASLRRVPAEVVGDVASSLRERLQDPELTVEQDEDSDGLERTAAVLQSLARSETRTLLEALEQQDPERAEQLRALVFTFDSLRLADDRGVQELLRMVESKSLALALHGCEPELQDKFFRNLSERASRMLKEEMELITAVRPDEQVAAQKEILGRALDLEREEKLMFESPSEGGAGG